MPFKRGRTSNFYVTGLKKVQILSEFEEKYHHGSVLFLHCQPEYVDCFEKASEIDSESRLKDKLVCMYFLILISVFKCLESGWGILMITNIFLYFTEMTFYIFWLYQNQFTA